MGHGYPSWARTVRLQKEPVLSSHVLRLLFLIFPDGGGGSEAEGALGFVLTIDQLVSSSLTTACWHVGLNCPWPSSSLYCLGMA